MGSRSQGNVADLLAEGFQALSQGEIERATRCCRQILKVQPKLVQAHFLVGLIALESKDRKTAVQAFGSVTRLEPGHAAAWIQLASLFMQEGQVNRADAALIETQKANPTDPMVQDMLGTLLSQLGDYQEAGNWYRKAVAQRGEHPPYLLNLANNLVFQGDVDAATEVFDKIIRIQPESPQAHWSLANARRAENTRHIEELKTLAEQPGLPAHAKAFYCYGLGKEYEDLERWEDAFAAFSAGASARRQTLEYDPSEEQRLFDCLEAGYTREWLEQTPTGDSSAAPIFILGQPRTGTTLVERIISAHSQVHSAGELQQFPLALRRLSNVRDGKRFSAELFSAGLDLDPQRLGRMYLETSRKMQGDLPRFVDKLPQNYLCLPLILNALPNAKVLHVTRGAMDACFASFKQLFADAYPYSYDQVEMASHHVRYRRLMACWRERFPGRFLDVSYEQIASDVPSNARRLLEFLELPFEEACVEFYLQQSAVSTASAVQVREPAHTRSIGRWHKYEQHLLPMLEILRTHGIEPDAPEGPG